MKNKSFRKPTTRIQFELNYLKEWLNPKKEFLFLVWLFVMGMLLLYTQNYIEMLKLDALVREQEMINNLMFRVLWF